MFSRLLNTLDCPCNFAAPQATSTGVNAHRTTVDQRLNAPNIRLERSVRAPVRVRNLYSKSDTFSANIALCHVCTSSILNATINSLAEYWREINMLDERGVP